MAGELIPLVMLPRYTTYASSGSQDFTTIAMDVTQFESAILNVWRSGLSSTGSPTFKIYFEESTDQTSWSTCAGTGGSGQDPGAATEAQYTATLAKRWFRVRVSLGGTDPVATCWCVGFLEERQR